ncbi:hypothetical protein MASR2M78_33390 [Treponema sp.]
MRYATRRDMDTSALLHEEADLRPTRPIKAFRRHFSQPCTVRLHYHESLELNLCQQTEGLVRIAGQEYDLAQVSLLVIPPLALHSYKILASRGSMLVVHIALHQLSDWLGQKGVSILLGNLPHTDKNWAEATRKVHALASQAQGANQAGTELNDTYACRISAGILDLMACLQKTSSSGSPIRLEQVKGTDTADLRHLIDFAQSRLGTKLSLEEAAKELGQSRATFCRWFKERAGISFGTYFEELRLEQARRRLESGSRLSLAAEASGYEDLSYFVKRFKRRYGCTPKVWQRRTYIR